MFIQQESLSRTSNLKNGLKNVIVLGSGRSGTSMAAGILSGSGFYMGSNIYPASISNPKGNFESWEINGINERLLAQVVPGRPPLLGRWIFHERPTVGQRWLAHVPLETAIPCPPKIKERIRKVVQKSPFCFKDPRFSYTLPAWRPFLKNVVFICIFREPTITATSILKVCKDAPYLRDFLINFDRVLEIWCLMYRHILEMHRYEGQWLFLHYDQLLKGDGLDRLERFVGTEINRDFPDVLLNRSIPKETASLEAKWIYKQLCIVACMENDEI